MLKNLELSISDEEAGMRLDKWLRCKFPTVTRVTVWDALEHGTINVNGTPGRKGYKLQVGDNVFIAELAEQSDVRVIPNLNLPLNVIYEDADLLVLNKPANLPVHPISFRENKTLANALVARYPELAAVGGQPLMPALVHRIDTDSSGLVLAAKNPEAYRDLCSQFRQKSVHKMYLAVVCGHVRHSGRIESYLVHGGGRKHRMVILDNAPGSRHRRAMLAVTEYEPLAVRQKLSLLRVVIHTGVTHQIRCQLARLGYPILGDRLYGECAGEEPVAGRLFLHAAAITFVHPVRREKVCFRSKPPPEFVELFPEALKEKRNERRPCAHM